MQAFYIPFKILLSPSCASLPSALFIESFASALVHVGVLPSGGCCHLQRGLDLTSVLFSGRT
jgi:hypothetical protein